MRLVAELLQLSATDLANHLGCAHLSKLDLGRRRAPRGAAAPERSDRRALDRTRPRARSRVFAASACAEAHRGRDPHGAGHRQRRGNARRDARRRGCHLPSAARRRALARPRRFPAQGRAAERARRLVVRGHGREARHGDARGHDPPALRLFEPARTAAGQRAAAGARRRAAPSFPARELSPRRLRRVLPARETAARNGARSTRRRHVPRAGAALRRLQLVGAMQRAPPRRRSPHLRGRHQPAADQGAAHAPERRHARAARRSHVDTEAEARLARSARAHARPSGDSAQSTPAARPAARGAAAWERARLPAPAGTLARRPVPRSRGRPARARGRPRVSVRRQRRAQRLHAALGDEPGRREARIRASRRPHPCRVRGGSGDARLSLRRVRADGVQAPVGPLRDARERARHDAARGAVRRSAHDRAALAARQRRDVFAEGPRAVLRSYARAGAACRDGEPARARVGNRDARGFERAARCARAIIGQAAARARPRRSARRRARRGARSDATGRTVSPSTSPSSSATTATTACLRRTCATGSRSCAPPPSARTATNCRGPSGSRAKPASRSPRRPRKPSA